MEACKRTASSGRQFRLRQRGMWVVAFTAIVVGAYGYGVLDRAAAAEAKPGKPAETATALSGLASLSGTVESTKPFKAAQVYIRNVDKRILYMVYTNAGAFRAVALLPGNYEINVQAKGLVSDVQKLIVKAGD